MDLGPLLLLGLGWLVVNAIAKAGRGSSEKPRVPPALPRPTPPPQGPRPGGGVVQTRGRMPVAGADATQREGMRLEQLLRELGRTLDQTAGPAVRRPDRQLPAAKDVEEGRSLEVAPVVRSLESGPVRGERAVVDQDDEAERIVAQRIAAAEANAAPLTGADHRAFDARIRQEPADKIATRTLTLRQLRQAFVWREILGPPVSLRGRGRGSSESR